MADRIERLQLFMILAFAALTLRLIHLQVIRGASYRQLADQNRLRLVPEPAPRGAILDRVGRLLASNQTVFRVAIIPQELEDLDAVLDAVSRVTGPSPGTLRQAFSRERSLSFLPATILPRASKETALRLEELQWQLPGLIIQADPVRHYPLGSTAAHLLGYLSQPTAEELPQLKSYGVQPKELVGRMGIERLLDQDLHGRPGGLMVEVNHRGHQVRVIGRRPPEPGQPVTLTIDAKLQMLIEQAFGTQPGACVVLDPLTGEVLAMVSVPAFSPEAFVSGDAESIRAWLNDPEAPMMNRATVGVYQPGSVMKLVTGSAGLEHGVITPTTAVNCPGLMQIGDRAFHCWNRDGHGPLTLTGALMQSCNVYFMHVGRGLGMQHLRAAMAQVGFGRALDWPLEQQPGHLPDRLLTEGEVALLSIGQGELLVTTLQTAIMVNVFANGGLLVDPWIVKMIAGRSTDHHAPHRRVGWSPATLEAVRAGMRAVVNNPAGTGHRAMSRLVTIAGKTGTAQTHIPGRTHGWFAGFCPMEQPIAAMAIVTEHGGSGGELPAEVAKQICEYLVAAAASPSANSVAPLPQPPPVQASGPAASAPVRTPSVASPQ